MPRVEFGSFTLDTCTRLLVESGEPIELGPKVIETLVVLVENAGGLVTRSALMERLWPDCFVQEANLTQNVYRLRKALARGGLGDAIETMPCRGYRFVAPIERIAGEAEERVAAPKHSLEASLPKRIGWFAGLAMLLFLVVPFSRPSAGAFAALTPESQRLYVLGRYHWNQRSEPLQVKESMRCFQSVVSRDPANPLGYAGLADAYITIVDSYCGAPLASCGEAAKLAVANARRSVGVGPGSAEAHTSYAMALFVLSRAYADADSEFARAIGLDERYALAHYWYGNSLLARGRLEEAASQYKRAIALEPASPGAYAWFAADEYYRGKYRSAVEYARESLAIAPHWRLAWTILWLAHEQLGERAAAAAALDHLHGDMRDAVIELDKR